MPWEEPIACLEDLWQKIRLDFFHAHSGICWQRQITLLPVLTTIGGWMHLKISGSLQDWGPQSSQYKNALHSCVVSLCERQLCSWAPPNLWTLVYSSQNNPLRCPELWGHPAKSMCGKEDRATWGPSERWAEVVPSLARSGSVVSKPLQSRGPEGSLGGVKPSPAVCRALCWCNQTGKRQRQSQKQTSTQRHHAHHIHVCNRKAKTPGQDRGFLFRPMV